MNFHFSKTLFWMAIPIAIQTLLFSSKAFVDTLLLAEISQEAVSATGIIGRIMLVAIITLMGVSTGGGYVAAQCAKDQTKLNSSVITTVCMSALLSLIIFVAVTLFDRQIIGLFTDNLLVIELAQVYLDIVLVSILLLAFSSVLASYLRVVDYSTLVSTIFSVGVLLNIGISLVLIVFYDMGIAGAAYGTLVGTILELIFILAFIAVKRMPLLVNIQFSKAQFSIIKEQVYTATSSSVVWSFGAFVFYSFLGRSSDEALHAISVIIPIESLLLSLTMGIVTASSILIGKAIPHESKDAVYQKAKTSIGLCMVCIVVIVGLFALFKQQVIAYFSQGNWSDSLDSYLTLMMIGVVIKSLSMQTMNGIIRSGGDGRFCMRLDIVMQWGIIIPTSFVMLKMGINPLLIYALVLFEELIKVMASMYRYNSDRWRNNLCEA